MSDLIYVETSIPSFFHETREGAMDQARRQWTREWWDVAPQGSLVTSDAVFDELQRAPEPKRSRCLHLLSSLPLLEASATTERMVATYVANRIMPQDARGDALHLALATFNHCAFIVTWNCRHLANANKKRHIEHVNRSLGFATPALVTPLQLLEL